MQMPMPKTAEETYESCQRVAPNRAIWFNQTGGAWASGEMSNTAYNHITTPNARSCAIMDGGQMMAPWSGNDANLPWYMQIPPSSAHPGGVNVLAGDGSVRFVKDSVSLAAWRAFGSRAGSEVMSADAF